MSNQSKKDKIESGGELKEELPEPRDEGDITSVWLAEAQNPKDRKDLADTLRHSDIQFRNMRRVVRGLFSQRQDAMYKTETFDRFDLGYQSALRDVYKLIPKTRSE